MIKMIKEAAARSLEDFGYKPNRVIKKIIYTFKGEDTSYGSEIEEVTIQGNRNYVTYYNYYTGSPLDRPVKFNSYDELIEFLNDPDHVRKIKFPKDYK